MNVHQIYLGSDGEATSALYARLEALGAVGLVAVNLFRAQKCSERAKVYRGRGYRSEAYERKNWSLGNLCAALESKSAALGLAWGWRRDPQQEFFPWVLYVELPTGQVSFHARERGVGPDYPREWDGSHHSAGRIVAWVAGLMKEVELRPEP